MRVEVERLIKQAERDLENAGKIVGVGAYEVSVFTAHQAVEKYLKAAWMELRREAPPRTHSLLELGNPLGAPAAVRKCLANLNPDYTTTRYPDAANGLPYEAYDKETAEAKVQTARQVIEWLRQLIKTKK